MVDDHTIENSLCGITQIDEVVGECSGIFIKCPSLLVFLAFFFHEETTLIITYAFFSL